MPFSCSDLKASGQIVLCSSHSSFTIMESYVDCFPFLTLKLAFQIEDLEPQYLNNHRNSGRNRGPEPGSRDGDMRSPRGCVFGKRLALPASSCVGFCPQPEEQASLNRWIPLSQCEFSCTCSTLGPELDARSHYSLLSSRSSRSGDASRAGQGLSPGVSAQTVLLP